MANNMNNANMVLPQINDDDVGGMDALLVEEALDAGHQPSGNLRQPTPPRPTPQPDVMPPMHLARTVASGPWAARTAVEDPDLAYVDVPVDKDIPKFTKNRVLVPFAKPVTVKLGDDLLPYQAAALEKGLDYQPKQLFTDDYRYRMRGGVADMRYELTESYRERIPRVHQIGRIHHVSEARVEWRTYPYKLHEDEGGHTLGLAPLGAPVSNAVPDQDGARAVTAVRFHFSGSGPNDILDNNARCIVSHMSRMTFSPDALVMRLAIMYYCAELAELRGTKLFTDGQPVDAYCINSLSQYCTTLADHHLGKQVIMLHFENARQQFRDALLILGILAQDNPRLILANGTALPGIAMNMPPIYSPDLYYTGTQQLPSGAVAGIDRTMVYKAATLWCSQHGVLELFYEYLDVVPILFWGVGYNRAPLFQSDKINLALPESQLAPTICLPFTTQFENWAKGPQAQLDIKPQLNLYVGAVYETIIGCAINTVYHYSGASMQKYTKRADSLALLIHSEYEPCRNYTPMMMRVNELLRTIGVGENMGRLLITASPMFDRASVMRAYMEQSTVRYQWEEVAHLLPKVPSCCSLTSVMDPFVLKGGNSQLPAAGVHYFPEVTGRATTEEALQSVAYARRHIDFYLHISDHTSGRATNKRFTPALNYREQISDYAFFPSYHKEHVTLTLGLKLRNTKASIALVQGPFGLELPQWYINRANQEQAFEVSTGYRQFRQMCLNHGLYDDNSGMQPEWEDDDDIKSTDSSQFGAVGNYIPHPRGKKSGTRRQPSVAASNLSSRSSSKSSHAASELAHAAFGSNVAAQQPKTQVLTQQQLKPASNDGLGNISFEQLQQAIDTVELKNNPATAALGSTIEKVEQHLMQVKTPGANQTNIDQDERSAFAPLIDRDSLITELKAIPPKNRVMLCERLAENCSRGIHSAATATARFERAKQGIIYRNMAACLRHSPYLTSKEVSDYILRTSDTLHPKGAQFRALVREGFTKQPDLDKSISNLLAQGVSLTQAYINVGRGGKVNDRSVHLNANAAGNTVPQDTDTSDPMVRDLLASLDAGETTAAMVDEMYGGITPGWLKAWEMKHDNNASKQVPATLPLPAAGENVPATAPPPPQQPAVEKADSIHTAIALNETVAKQDDDGDDNGLNPPPPLTPKQEQVTKIFDYIDALPSDPTLAVSQMMLAYNYHTAGKTAVAHMRDMDLPCTAHREDLPTEPVELEAYLKDKVGDFIPCIVWNENVARTEDDCDPAVWQLTGLTAIERDIFFAARECLVATARARQANFPELVNTPLLNSLTVIANKDGDTLACQNAHKVFHEPANELQNNMQLKNKGSIRLAHAIETVARYLAFRCDLPDSPERKWLATRLDGQKYVPKNLRPGVGDSSQLRHARLPSQSPPKKPFSGINDNCKTMSQVVQQPAAPSLKARPATATTADAHIQQPAINPSINAIADTTPRLTPIQNTTNIANSAADKYLTLQQYANELFGIKSAPSESTDDVATHSSNYIRDHGGDITVAELKNMLGISKDDPDVDASDFYNALSSDSTWLNMLRTSSTKLQPRGTPFIAQKIISKLPTSTLHAMLQDYDHSVKRIPDAQFRGLYHQKMNPDIVQDLAQTHLAESVRKIFSLRRFRDAVLKNTQKRLAKERNTRRASHPPPQTRVIQAAPTLPQPSRGAPRQQRRPRGRSTTQRQPQPMRTFKDYVESQNAARIKTNKYAPLAERPPIANPAIIPLPKSSATHTNTQNELLATQTDPQGHSNTPLGLKLHLQRRMRGPDKRH
jgi:hypothetical protein